MSIRALTDREKYIAFGDLHRMSVWQKDNKVAMLAKNKHEVAFKNGVEQELYVKGYDEDVMYAAEFYESGEIKESFIVSHVIWPPGFKELYESAGGK